MENDTSLFEEDFVNLYVAQIMFFNRGELKNAHFTPFTKKFSRNNDIFSINFSTISKECISLSLTKKELIESAAMNAYGDLEITINGDQCIITFYQPE